MYNFTVKCTKCKIFIVQNVKHDSFLITGLVRLHLLTVDLLRLRLILNQQLK